MEIGTHAFGEAMFGAPLEDLAATPVSPLTSVTVDGVACVLFTIPPDLEAGPVRTQCKHITKRDAGLTQREGRRSLASTLRWKLEYTALLNYSEGRALRAGLRAYGNKPILCPMWPAAALVSDVASAPLTGGLKVTFEPDWSLWELHTGAAVGSYTAAAMTAPVLYGRFDKLPDPQAVSDERGPCAIMVAERSAAAYAIAPRSTVTIAGPSLHSTTWPLFAEHVQYTRPMASGGIDLRIEREQIGYGREELENYASQPARSTGTLQFEGDTESAMRLIALFHSRKGNAGQFWWPGAHAEWRLAADTSGGSADITLEEEPAEPHVGAVLLRSAGGTIAARLVSAVLGTVVTLSSAPGVFTRNSTSLLPLYFGRFAGAEIELDWSNPRAVTADLKLIELPTENVLPEGETINTTIGALAPKWWGYVITDGVQTWKLTSYDAEIDAGGLGEFTPASIDHIDDDRELNLVKHEMALKIGYFEGSPFERMKVDRYYAPTLQVQIYEGTIAAPEAAVVKFTGEVRAPKFTGSVCECKIGGLTSLLDTRGPIAVQSRRCWYKFGGTLCGVDVGALEIAADLVEIDVNGKLVFNEAGTAGFPAVPLDHFRGGTARRLLPDGTVQRYRVLGSAAITTGDVDYVELPFHHVVDVQDLFPVTFRGVVRLYDSGTVQFDGEISTTSPSVNVEYKVWVGPDDSSGSYSTVGTAPAGGAWQSVLWHVQPSAGNYVHCIVDRDLSQGGGGDGKRVRLWSFASGGWMFPLDFSVKAGTQPEVTGGTIDRTSTTIDVAGGANYNWPGNYAYGESWDALNPPDWSSGGYDATAPAGVLATPTFSFSRTIPDTGASGVRVRVSVVQNPSGVVSRCDIGPFFRAAYDPAVQSGPDPVVPGDSMSVDILGAVTPPPSAYPEEDWTLVPSCDRSYERCGALLNAANHGGLPHLPKTSPSIVPVAQETPAAGKK